MPHPSPLAVRNRFAVGLALVLLVVLADQLVKWWILTEVMNPPRVIPVTDFFNLVLTWNRGVSFGLFSDGAQFITYVLIALALAIAGTLMVWLWRTDRWIIGIALGLVVGGALGNVIDRIRFGAVVDFLDFHWAGWHWPAFNVADSAITVGVAMIVLDSLLAPPSEEE